MELACFKYIYFFKSKSSDSEYAIPSTTQQCLVLRSQTLIFQSFFVVFSLLISFFYSRIQTKLPHFICFLWYPPVCNNFPSFLVLCDLDILEEYGQLFGWMTCNSNLFNVFSCLYEFINLGVKCYRGEVPYSVYHIREYWI